MSTGADGDVRGQTEAIVKNGEAHFDSTLFVGKPGSSNVVYSLVSNFLDVKQLEFLFGSNFTVPTIQASFRECISGEI